MRSQFLITLVTLFGCGVPAGMAQAANEASLTPLMKASRRGDLPTIKHLIAGGADVRQRTTAGQTALYEAIEWRHPEVSNVPVVEALLQAGADANEVQIFGLSALEISLTRDHVNPDVTLLLLRAGAKVTTDCPKSDSLVSLATQDSSLEVISALVARGAPVNCRDEHGQTALHWAALNGQADRVALLLKNGADRGLRNSEGMTPLDVARTTNPDAHVQMLFASTRAELAVAPLPTNSH